MTSWSWRMRKRADSVGGAEGRPVRACGFSGRAIGAVAASKEIELKNGAEPDIHVCGDAASARAA